MRSGKGLALTGACFVSSLFSVSLLLWTAQLTGTTRKYSISVAETAEQHDSTIVRVRCTETNEPQGYILRQTQHLDGTLLKRQDAIRALVIVCVTLAALGILVPAMAPAMTPMQGPVTTIVTTSQNVGYGWWNFTFTFIFSNTTTTFMTSITTTTSGMLYRTSQIIYTATVTSPVTSWTTFTTYSRTITSGTTIVPSTSTTWITAAATTNSRTITTTASETVTSTSYTTISVTSTSTYAATGTTPPTPPPIPGFPLESILAGLALGLLGVHLIYRHRLANRKRPS